MSVRYKFKNDLAFTTLHIDGFDISVIDLKKAIHQAKKMGRITDFDLIITNSETEEAYAKDEDLVPKKYQLDCGQTSVASRTEKSLGGGEECQCDRNRESIRFFLGSQE